MKPSPNPKPRIIKIAPTGRLTFIYDDTLASLLEAGVCRVERASHVEPKETLYGIRWFADLSPVGGPNLGPYSTRAEALQEEVEWLTAHYIRSEKVSSSL